MIVDTQECAFIILDDAGTLSIKFRCEDCLYRRMCGPNEIGILYRVTRYSMSTLAIGHFLDLSAALGACVAGSPRAAARFETGVFLLHQCFFACPHLSPTVTAGVNQRDIEPEGLKMQKNVNRDELKWDTRGDWRRDSPLLHCPGGG